MPHTALLGGPGQEGSDRPWLGPQKSIPLLVQQGFGLKESRLFGGKISGARSNLPINPRPGNRIGGPTLARLQRLASERLCFPVPLVSTARRHTGVW